MKITIHQDDAIKNTIDQDNHMNLKSIQMMPYREHKKPTKRIPILMQIKHPVTGQIITKEVLTKDVDTYLKKYNGLNSNGSKWTMVPLKKYRVWLSDSVESEGGTWWYCFEDARGYLRQEGYDHPVEELDTLQQYLAWGYKIEQL
jgi:hypothetical protein